MAKIEFRIYYVIPRTHMELDTRATVISHVKGVKILCEGHNLKTISLFVGDPGTSLRDYYCKYTQIKSLITHTNINLVIRQTAGGTSGTYVSVDQLFDTPVLTDIVKEATSICDSKNKICPYDEKILEINRPGNHEVLNLLLRTIDGRTVETPLGMSVNERIGSLDVKTLIGLTNIISACVKSGSPEVDDPPKSNIDKLLHVDTSLVTGTNNASNDSDVSLVTGTDNTSTQDISLVVGTPLDTNETPLSRDNAVDELFKTCKYVKQSVEIADYDCSGVFVVEVTSDDRKFFVFGSSNNIQSHVVNFIKKLKGTKYSANVIQVISVVEGEIPQIMDKKIITVHQHNAYMYHDAWGHMSVAEVHF